MSYRTIEKDARAAVETLKAKGLHMEANAVQRLIHSRAVANGTNKSLAADLRKALADLETEKKQAEQLWQQMALRDNRILQLEARDGIILIKGE